MKITSFKIRNYRTFESVDLSFPAAYAAICGPNDSGKTNVVRAIRALMKEESPLQLITFRDEEEFTVKDNYPKWKETEPSKREIQFEITLSLHIERDAGFVQFLTKQLSLEIKDDTLELTLELTHCAGQQEPFVKARALGNEYTDLEAQEALKKLQTSKSILFHNSTQTDSRFPFRDDIGGYIRAMSREHEALVDSMKKKVKRGLAKISKSHKKELESLLGRLGTKYIVGLSMPAFDFSHVPFNVTLGQKKYDVPLSDWGSGTKNRTLILLTLFRARQIADSEPSASKVTPIIVIEEPESFLHPSAQAEFGRVLNDLAEEFQVQVIVTTHSPYLLNMDNPDANILLSRHTRYNQLRESERIDTGGDNWVRPFSLALGLESGEFRPWKGLFLSGADAILLVEGKTDKEYFEMLRDSAHGSNRLDFTGDIVAYGGTGKLKNTVLLRFVKDRHPRLFVTYDLDATQLLEKSLKALGLERKKQYLPLGRSSAGAGNIEGLLPKTIMTAVYANNPDLVQAATSGTPDERKSARNRLKELMLKEFKDKSIPGEEYFAGFYPIVKLINKALG